MNHEQVNKVSGDYYEEVTPVPIPNTEVKLFSADNTWWVAVWENRSSPDFIYERKQLLAAFFHI